MTKIKARVVKVRKEPPNPKKKILGERIRKIATILGSIIVVGGMIWVLIWVVTGTREMRERRAWLNNYGEITVGRVTGLSSDGQRSSVQTNFVFYVDSVRHRASQSFANARRSQVDMYFIVLYNPDNLHSRGVGSATVARRAIIRTDLPVRDNFDFQRHKEYIQQRRRERRN